MAEDTVENEGLSKGEMIINQAETAGKGYLFLKESALPKTAEAIVRYSLVFPDDPNDSDRLTAMELVLGASVGKSGAQSEAEGSNFKAMAEVIGKDPQKAERILGELKRLSKLLEEKRVPVLKETVGSIRSRSLNFRLGGETNSDSALKERETLAKEAWEEISQFPGSYLQSKV